MKPIHFIFNAVAVSVTTAVVLFSSCQSSVSKNSGNDIIKDSLMITYLCPTGKNIFTGSDGAISIPIDKGKSIWMFGDSFMGEVVNNQRDSITSPLIWGQIFVELDEKNRARTICGGTKEHPTAVVSCDDVNGNKAMYWPHHGFVKNGILHTYMIKIVTDPVLWFYPDGLLYVRFSLPDYKIIDKTEVDSFPINHIWYGWGFFEKNGYYYTYGGTEDRKLHIARGRLINNKLMEWKYFTGKTWSDNPAESKELQGIDIKISTQFSVFPYNSKYILLTQEGDKMSNNIYSYIANSPIGPWYNKKLLYTIPEPSMNKNVHSYNAMAHPQYSKDGKLLVSYCINTSITELLWKDASIYRPRFIYVPYSMILNDLLTE